MFHSLATRIHTICIQRFLTKFSVFLLFASLLSFVVPMHSPMLAQSIRISTDGSESTQNQYTIATGRDRSFYLEREDFYGAPLSNPIYSNVEVVRLSRNRAKIGLLRVDESIEHIILDDDGNLLSASVHPFYGEDPSLEIYTWDDGRSVVRENVSNFMFYDAGGKLLFPVSNASGSRDGEAFSELASDPAGETVVIYNPSIRRSDGSFSSRAALLNRASGSLSSFYGMPDEQIFYVDVSRSGSFITITAGNEGEDSKVIVFDRFGNLLFEKKLDFEATRASFLAESDQVFAYSGSRAAVYDVDSWNRIGSSSVRKTILTAGFFPEDGWILLCTGDLEGDRVTNVEFVAVDVVQRKIAREPLNRNLLRTKVAPYFEPFSERDGSFFVLHGMGIPVTLRPTF